MGAKTLGGAEFDWDAERRAMEELIDSIDTSVPSPESQLALRRQNAGRYLGVEALPMAVAMRYPPAPSVN